MDLPVEPPEVVERMGPHPLTIHLIAESIFRNLDSIQDLLTCRKVAWPWRQMVIPMINYRRQESRPCTFRGSEAETGLDNLDAALLTKYMKYLEEEAEMEPKLLLSHFRFYNLSLEQPLVRQFLDQFGHTIRKLNLSVDERTDYRKIRLGGSVKSLWSLLATQCSQLEDLKLIQVDFEPTNEDTFPPFYSKIKRLKFQYYDRQERLQRLQPLITNLFLNCHLLERLILNHNICPEVFSSALSESPHLSALKELTLDCVEVIRRWRQSPARRDNIQRNLRLKKLKIEHVFKEEVNALNWFLQTQKTSLETLIIVNCSYEHLESFGFLNRILFNEQEEPENAVEMILPCADVMEKLREFQVTTDFGGLRFLFQAIDFKKQFPCLSTLIFDGPSRGANKHAMDFWLVSGSEPQLTLEGLELPYKISHEHLKRAGEIFPNVKKLRIVKLDELAVRQLFSQWPRLECLYLDTFKGHDSILTGLNPRKLEAAEKLRMKTILGIDAILSLINPSKVVPSITNFKELKELIISSNQPLTDLTLRFAISQLKNLEFLGVRGQQFSEEGIKSIKSIPLIPHLKLSKDENKRWGETGFQLYRKDLSKQYNPKLVADFRFESYYFPHPQ